MALKYDKLLNDYDKHCQRIAKSTTIRINETPAEKVRRMPISKPTTPVGSVITSPTLPRSPAHGSTSVWLTKS